MKLLKIISLIFTGCLLAIHLYMHLYGNYSEKEEGWILVALCLSLLFTIALHYYNNKKSFNNPHKNIFN